MRIAVTYENGEVFQHFGHSEQFKLYDVEESRIIAEQIVDTNGSGGHGALAGFLQAVKADALICGGIGMGAQTALADAGIKFYAGVQGSADAAAKALAEGNLAYDPDACCDHHDHDHGDDHNCGQHNEHHGGDCGTGQCAGHHGLRGCKGRGCKGSCIYSGPLVGDHYNIFNISPCRNQSHFGKQHSHFIIP